MNMADGLMAAFDLLLCGGLLWLAWKVTTSPNLFRGVILFMVFSLLMALVWARLKVADLALAEAAIGAGVTGALLLNACRAVILDTGDDPEGDAPEAPPGLPRWLLATICAIAGSGLAVLMVTLDEAGGPAPEAVLKAFDQHLLDNPVTAVLLDFRAHDTLLEVAVLLLALVGGRMNMDQRRLPVLHPPAPSHDPMLGALVNLTTPVLLLTALYLLWAGGHHSGGAFQAGALLGALGIVYYLAGRVAEREEISTANAVFLTLGLALFAIFGCVSLIWSSAPLSWPQTGGYLLVMVIELALMLSIGMTLLLLFSGGAGLGIRPPPEEHR